MGVVMFGLTTYVPPLIQGVEGGSPVDAGAAVAAMSIGWPIGSMLGGRLMLRFGTRRIVVIGGFLAALGCAMVTQLPSFTPLWYAMISTGVCGFGMGLGVDRDHGVDAGLSRLESSRHHDGSRPVLALDRRIRWPRPDGRHPYRGGGDAFRPGTGPVHARPAVAGRARGHSCSRSRAASRVIFWIVFVAGVSAFLVAYRTMPALNIRELRRGRPPKEDPKIAGDAAEVRVGHGRRRRIRMRRSAEDREP